MSTLIRIGQYVINIDQVTDIAFHPEDSKVLVYFAFAEGGGGDSTETAPVKQTYQQLTGYDAEAFMWWIDRNSKDILGAYRERAI